MGYYRSHFFVPPAQRSEAETTCIACFYARYDSIASKEFLDVVLSVTSDFSLHHIELRNDDVVYFIGFKE
jgi:hypothetical protein